MEVITKPQWGTRPSNRRELIVDAATGLFAERGYDHVTVTDIATAVSVGPSALYRHFPGKDEILAAALQQTLSGFAAVIAASTPERVLPQLAEYALNHRQAGVLWQREARYLPAELSRPLRAQVVQLCEQLGDSLRRTGRGDAPPSLLHAVAALSVILSPSFHHLQMAPGAFQSELAEIAARVISTDLRSTVAADPGPAPAGLTRTSRREVILNEAVRLFARHTYAGTGVEEIAAAAGLSTSSVYTYFPSKQDILIKALQRGNGYVQLKMANVFARATSPQQALAETVAFYADFALRHHEVVTILITEARSLPDLDGADLLQSQRDFVGDWVHLLQQTRPSLDATRAGVTARAAVVLLNDLARSGEIRGRAAAHEIMCALAGAALGLNPFDPPQAAP